MPLLGGDSMQEETPLTEGTVRHETPCGGCDKPLNPGDRVFFGSIDEWGTTAYCAKCATSIG